LTTSQVSAHATARFHSPFRLVLNLPSLDNSYFKTSLCTLSDDGTQVRILGNSQIKLTSLPTNPPQQFTYPLLSIQDTRVEVAIVTARATIAPVNLADAAPPARPGALPFARQQGPPLFQPQWQAPNPFQPFRPPGRPRPPPH
jgi:hypothetical protein